MRYLLGLAVVLWAAAAQAEMRVGILAPQGPEQAQDRWAGMIDSLSTTMGMPITFHPVSAQDGTTAFFDNHIDVLVGNPVQSAVVVDTMNAQPVASMVSTRGAKFAGVIVVSADSTITTLQDLSGMRIATLGNWAAGGYLYQSSHLVRNGLAGPDDLGIRVKGRNQNDLVELVKAGAADAAFIRTGVLEGLIAKGAVTAGELRVLDDQKQSPDDLHRTTRWYPEWMVSVQPGLDPAIAAKLRSALVAVDGQSPAARQAKVRGFQAPLDLGGVIEAMQVLRVAPYDK